jgi:Ala-tRNA(Pro) deacylase
MNGQEELYRILNELKIAFSYHEHPPVATVEEAMKYWKEVPATHCKNIFLRNHRGDKHYLVILECSQKVDIHDLEKRLRQGKISFASERRMNEYLGLKPGSVSPFGLINDKAHNVYLFIDENLQKAGTISFHPNVNTASLYISYADFLKFLDWTGNPWEYVKLYD